MKKAFGIISLLATSAGVLAIPAAARDRADNRYTAAYTETCYGHARERGRDFRQMDRRKMGNRGDAGNRGEMAYRGDMGYRGAGRNWR
ncbi:MAG TPA: hypothetical protein VKX45_23710 [Bryobacteraceae bacterium]|jgi:hypothetical protein|nr:hypothetical protein [Bryobacteraceae bacterium]